MHINANGLIIGVMDVREGDRYLTVLTDGAGKIKVNAKGAGRLGRLTASSQLFAYSKMTLFETKGNYRLDSAEPIAQFYGLSANIGKLSLASYFAELLNLTTNAGMDCAELLELGVAAFYALSSGKQEEALLKAAFEWRLMTLSGYEPDLICCAVCGKAPAKPVFHISEGALCCEHCRETAPFSMSYSLTGGALDALRYMACTDIKKTFSFSLGSESLASLIPFCEMYCVSRLEKEPATLAFYKGLYTGKPTEIKR